MYVSVLLQECEGKQSKSDSEREREGCLHLSCSSHNTSPHNERHETAQYQASHTSRAAADAGQGDTREVSTPPGD